MTGVESPLPSIAIVGRPNVGKSTLVNRIAGGREAIVEQKPGVTRDRKELEAEWQGRHFIVVDSGGWVPGGSALDQKVSRQSEQAIARADAVILVVDASVGITSEDDSVANLVRRTDQPIFLAANKVDSPQRAKEMWQYLSLGLGDAWAISALHGDGTGDLLDAVLAVLPDEPEPEPDPVGENPDDEQGRELFSVALVGRPNVGKSTLYNRMVGEDRAVVHDMPGTTRDTTDTVVATDAGPIRFVDTAGMRRRAKVEDGTEYFSFVRALRAVDGADVALLIIDSSSGITHQDQRLAERVDAAGCPIVVILNKWDITGTEQRALLTEQLEDKLHFLPESAVIRMSALTGRGVSRLIPALDEAITDYHTRIPTGRVNQVIRRAQQAQPGPHGARVLYATQGAVDPPTFTLFANKTLPATYVRYLERYLRRECELGGTPIKMRVRQR